jgi:hypothetical protein
MEGLLVFVGSEPRPDFEAWLDELHLRGDERQPKGVLEDEAWEIYADPPRMRSGSVHSIPSDVRARTFGQLKVIGQWKEEYVELPGLKGRKLEWPVRPAM